MPTFMIEVCAEKETLSYSHDAADMDKCIAFARDEFSSRKYGELNLIKVYPPNDYSQLRDYLLDQTRAVGLAWLPTDMAGSTGGEYRNFVVEIAPAPEGDPTLARARQAAPELLEALDQARQALNTAPRFDVPSLDCDSYDIAALCDRTIAAVRGPINEPQQPEPQRQPDRSMDFDR